jgi:spectinomycin phosphotransferase
MHALPLPSLLPRWQPETYEGIRSALVEMDRPWATVGPFAEPARQLVRTNASAVARRLADFDARSVGLLSHRHDVISHGEPHAANVLVRAPSNVSGDRGSPIALLDWDTVRAAPRERDLAVVLPAADSPDLEEAVSVYLEAAGDTVALNPDVIALFREEWALNDIDVTLRQLRAAHADTADTQAALRILATYTTGET